jgi:hypothetical protein
MDSKLPIEPKIVKQLSALGYQASVIPPAKFRQLKEDVNTIDFSGWPLITHRGLSSDLAYAICQAIDLRQNVIPVDDEDPLDMKSFAAGRKPRRSAFPCIQGQRDTMKRRAICKNHSLTDRHMRISPDDI